jgi:hypothetical protein
MALRHIVYCLLVLCVANTLCANIIQQYVDAAIIKGANSVTIPPGTYLNSLGALGVHLNLTNVNDFTIYAYNVTMMCTVRARAIDISNCVNVSIYGLVVDYDPLTFTQGTIVALNNDYLDLQIHDGYPVIPWARINVVDPKTLFFKDGMGFMWDISANISSPGVVRVYRSSGGGFYTAQIGDYATLAGGPDGDYACHAVGINFCSNTAFVDVTVHCAPGFGLAEWGGEGGLTLENFRLVPGPMPPNATVPRLQTSSWDGIEHSSVKKGPLVNNMAVALAGDDTWSAVSDAWQIAEIDSANRQITFTGAAPYTIYAGDSLRLRNEQIYPNEQVVVVKIDMASYDSLPLHAVYCSRCAAKALRKITNSPNFTVSVDRDIPANWQVSDFLYSTDRQTSGFILQNSYVRSKGRGALVKSPHGLIQNNYFYGGTAGVEVSPEITGATGSDASVGYDLTIRNNTIVHTGYHETFDDASYGADGAVAFFSYTSSSTIRGPNAFLNMVVEGNRFDDVNGINIGIAASNGVLVENNMFTNTMPVNYSVQGKAFGWNNGYVVFLTQSNNITLKGNVVLGNPSPYKIGNLFVNNVTSLIGGNGGIIQG